MTDSMQRRTIVLYADPSDEDVEYQLVRDEIGVWEKGHPAPNRQMTVTKQRMDLWTTMFREQA